MTMGARHAELVKLVIGRYGLKGIGRTEAVVVKQCRLTLDANHGRLEMGPG